MVLKPMSLRLYSEFKREQYYFLRRWVCIYNADKLGVAGCKYGIVNRNHYFMDSQTVV